MASGGLASLLGYALSIKNPDLGVDVMGSPHEVLEKLGVQGVDVEIALNHPRSSIDGTEVFQEAPRLTFVGGPHADTILQLLEAIPRADESMASRALSRDVGALIDHASASIPLLVAVSSRHAAMVKLLLAAGASVDALGQFGMTPLHWAAALGDDGVVRILLGAGADWRKLSWFYVNALELAELNGRADAKKAIYARAGKDATTFAMEMILERMVERSRAKGR